MRNSVTESTVQDVALKWLAELQFAVRHGPEIAPGESVSKRQVFKEVVLVEALRAALRDIRKALGQPVPEWEIKNHLAALKHLGLVSPKGYGRGARWMLN